jgi:hypothetical protein
MHNPSIPTRFFSTIASYARKDGYFNQPTPNTAIIGTPEYVIGYALGQRDISGDQWAAYDKEQSRNNFLAEYNHQH